MPIIIPDKFNIYKIIGIDPGINNTGVSIVEIEYNTNTIRRISAFTIHPVKLPNLTGLDYYNHSSRTITLYKLKGELYRVFTEIEPSLVICESPFFNRLCPMAYGSLLEVVSAIRDVVISLNKNIPFNTIEPLLVKKVVGAGMVAGKADIKTKISNLPAITDVLIQDINTLDEHSLDAIAVAYAFISTGA